MPLIALDADGVLLDYHAAYRLAWERAFGDLPAIRDRQAYWPIDRWHVQKLEGKRLEHFRSQFDECFWSSIPAYDGAVDACNRLRSAGFNLVCVSAIEERFVGSRASNLARCGFPIDQVFATGSISGATSPKARTLSALRPVAFVDDFLPYMRGLEPSIHTALLLREPNGSPNVGAELTTVDSIHQDFAEFANWWLARQKSA